MWHLIKNNETDLYEVAFVTKGRYIGGTQQGYENKKDALHAIVLMTETAHNYLFVQDDSIGVKLCLHVYNMGRSFTIKETDDSLAEKPYIPSLAYKPLKKN